MDHFSCFEPRVQGWGRLKVRLRAKVSMNLFRNVALYVAYVPCPIIPDICHRNHKHKPEDEDDSQWQSGIVFTEEFLERLSTYVACLPHLWLESFSCWERNFVKMRKEFCNSNWSQCRCICWGVRAEALRPWLPGLLGGSSVSVADEKEAQLLKMRISLPMLFSKLAS